uniref:Ovule protein n=1 Tax=Steinernema glaseri TaxID=37863 RepID=A0A1I7ZA70_9BILA
MRLMVEQFPRVFYLPGSSGMPKNVMSLKKLKVSITKQDFFEGFQGRRIPEACHMPDLYQSIWSWGPATPFLSLDFVFPACGTCA